MTDPEEVGKRGSRRFLLGCLTIALILFAILCFYIVVGHWNAVGSYRPPPWQRP